MTIGVNANEANVVHRVGSGQYAFELLSHLNQVQNNEMPFKLYLEQPPMADFPKESKNWQYQVLGSQRLWTLTRLQTQIIKEKINNTSPSVLFTPSHYTPLLLPTKSIISVMETSFEHDEFASLFKKRDLYQLRYWTRFSVKQASKILTISNFSKAEIEKTYQVPSDKVVVTYPGYDKTRFSPEVKGQKSRIKSVLEKYKIKSPYFVFLGTLQPRKNLTRLIEAFSELGTNSHQLVVVGMKNEGRGGWLYEQFFIKVKELGLGDRVIFTGYAPDQDVPYLFAGSEAFVLPSLYEGFGIPAIEAMATGVPVVVSNVSSLPEICGKSAFYVDNPNQVKSIRHALSEVLKSPQGEINSRIQFGLDWVKRYNWSQTAKDSLKVMLEVANKA